MASSLPESGTYNRDLRELVLDGDVDFDVDTPQYTYCLDHPDVHRPSLAVYENHAFCYTCHKRYSRREFSQRFTPLEMAAAKLKAGNARRAVRAPVDASLLSGIAHEVLLDEEAKLTYLEQRGIDRLTVRLYQLGHNGMAYTIPVFTDAHNSQGDNILNIRFRRDDIEFPDGRSKYWGLRGHNDVAWYPFPPNIDEYVILTEGEYDALLLRRYDLPAFSVTNGSQAGYEVIAKSQVPWLLLCRDQDDAGVEGTEALIEYLGEHSPGTVTTNITWPGYKDVTEVWQRDPARFQRIVDGLQKLLREGHDDAGR